MNPRLIAALLLSANYFTLIISQSLTVLQNGLTQEETDYSKAYAVLAIDQSTNKNSIATKIVNDMSNRLGGSWFSLITNITNNNESGSALNLQSNQFIRFIYGTNEILIIKASNVTSNTSSTFAQVLSEAKHASYKQNFLWDPENRIKDILTIVNNSLYRDYSSCYVTWIDHYGDCYGPMAVYIEESIYNKFSGKWSVTAGEEGSHFQAVTEPARASQQMYAQFNYANLHFNVIHFNEQ